MATFRVITCGAAMAALAAGCGTAGPALERRTPVSGTVSVGGKPAGGLIVRFHLEPGSADSRAPALVEARTAADGGFMVSQNAPNDGLAPGKYVMTFFWPPDGNPESEPAADQLKGKYADPAKSTRSVVVGESAVTVPPIGL